jgi:O-antigen/teichoic acid export membrane protein
MLGCNLKKRVLDLAKKTSCKNGDWVSITLTGMNVVDFVMFTYLARILSSEEFGLMSFRCKRSK